jgi:hypothetical protein
MALFLFQGATVPRNSIENQEKDAAERDRLLAVALAIARVASPGKDAQ